MLITSAKIRGKVSMAKLHLAKLHLLLCAVF